METSFTTQTLKEDLEASAKKAEKVQAETDEFAKIEAEVEKTSPPKETKTAAIKPGPASTVTTTSEATETTDASTAADIPAAPHTPKTLNPLGQNYEISIDQSSSFNDPIQFPIAIRVIGKLGEIVAHVPPNSTASEGFTKLRAKSEQVIGDVTHVRVSVVGGPLSPLTPFHVDAVTVTHVIPGGESWTVNVGAQIDQFHGSCARGSRLARRCSARSGRRLR